MIYRVFLVIFILNHAKSQNVDLLPSRDVCGYSEDYERTIGEKVASLAEFPWLALLYYSSSTESYYCTGALINDRYVLTAAHCVVGDVIDYVGNVTYVRLGEWDLDNDPDCPENQGCNETPLDINVERIIAHKDFLKEGNHLNMHHDIALLRLKEPVQFTEFIAPVCLPTMGEKGKTNDTVFISGWSSDSDENGSVKLKHDTKIIDQKLCADLFMKNRKISITNNQLCAGINEAKCNADSGSPLVNLFPRSSTWYLEGVMSYAPSNCRNVGTPIVYTRVSEYMEWIKNNIKP